MASKSSPFASFHPSLFSTIQVSQLERGFESGALDVVVVAVVGVVFARLRPTQTMIHILPLLCVARILTPLISQSSSSAHLFPSRPVACSVVCSRTQDGNSAGRQQEQQAFRATPTSGSSRLISATLSVAQPAPPMIMGPGEIWFVGPSGEQAGTRARAVKYER